MCKGRLLNGGRRAEDREKQSERNEGVRAAAARYVGKRGLSLPSGTR